MLHPPPLSDIDLFYTTAYRELTAARLSHLNEVGLPLENRRVLELGSGPGDLTGFFVERGCSVVAVDVRPNLLAELSHRYPQVETHVLDVNVPGALAALGRFDIVFCYGLLYHLEQPSVALEGMARACKHYLLIETCLSPRAGSSMRRVAENSSWPTQSVGGKGCLPTRAWMFAKLRKSFPHVYQSLDQPDHSEFPLSWTDLPDSPRFRGIFIASRRPLHSPHLSDSVVRHHRPFPGRRARAVLDRPALRPDMRLEVVSPSRVLLRSETESHWIGGQAYATVIPLIDGRRSRDEIVAAASEQIAPEEVHFVLSALEKGEFLGQACPKLPRESAAYWRSLGVMPEDATERLGRASVAVCAPGRPDRISSEFRKAVRSWGVRVEPEGSLRVYIVNDYCDAALDAINRDAVGSRRTWMLLNPFGRICYVGPVFRPGITACWACLAHRLEENRLTAARAICGPPSAATRTLALGIAANELAKWLASGGGTDLDSGLLTVDVATLAISRHAVMRRPQCNVCGHPRAHAKRRPISLRPQPRRFTGDGGHRTCPPEETLKRLEPHLSPITGILSGMEQYAHEPEGPPVFIGRLNGPLDSWFHHEALEGRPLSVAGKGMTAAQARVSCLAEAVERYSLCFQGDERVVRARYSKFGPQAIPPSELLNFSEAQYSNRQESNASHPIERRIPEPFNQDVPIDWVGATSLVDGTLRYIPAAFCYFDCPDQSGSRFCCSDSNGCASGNTVEEAALQGFLELVERDAIAIWWYNRVRRPGLDIAGFGDPRLDAAAASLAKSGSLFHVLDLTTDLGIPVFAAISASEDGQAVRLGYGAHLDARLAALRAVAELHQTLIYRGNRDPAGITFASHPHLAPCSAAPMPRRESLDDSGDLLDELNTCVAIAQRRGLEVFMIDLTRPEIAFPVVRVIVPGLRHHRLRLGPGRLYEVPVALGWLDRPLLESELNPDLAPV